MFPLWPEHAQAYCLFLQLRTQWRHGFNGPTGLDYAAVLDHLERGLRMPHKRVQPLYLEILAMERGALEGWNELRAERGG